MKNLFLFSLSSLMLTLLFVGCRNDKIDRYEYVDLGLSVKWATCTVGADCPEEYGNLYAWGEISPSNEDILATKVIEKATKNLGIKLIDHLIIFKGGFSSINRKI